MIDFVLNLMFFYPSLQFNCLITIKLVGRKERPNLVKSTEINNPSFSNNINGDTHITYT